MAQLRTDSLKIGNATLRSGTGTPEGAVTGAVGDLFLRTDGALGTTLYTKQSGSGNTGWGSPDDLVKPSATTLTDAQIKALPTTAVTLIAAPGSGKRIRPLSVSYLFDTSAGAYTNINATYADVHLELGSDYAGYGPVKDTAASPALTQFTDVLGTAADRIYDQAIPPQKGNDDGGGGFYVITTGFGNRNQQENAALKIVIDNNGSGNLTGGNAANTLKVIVYYAVESF